MTLPKKILSHYKLYKVSNPPKKLPLLSYLIEIWLYRLLICPIITAPLFVIYFLFYPIVKIRFFPLIASAIGHFATDTEALLARLNNLDDDKFINTFYLRPLLEPAISNFYLLRMWKRVIFIFPLIVSPIIKILDAWLMYFLGNHAYGLYGKKKLWEERGAGRDLAGKDITGYLKHLPAHLSFTEEEHDQAKQLLKKMGLKPNAKYVCLFVRSAAYNRSHPTWNLVPERNSNLATYMKACNFLAEKGYYVLRMGKTVDDMLTINHPNIIDYAQSPARSDFMDIYLAAHCHFFITTTSGLECIAEIFRRPILTTNSCMISLIPTQYPHLLCLPKLGASKKPNNLMTFKENFTHLSIGTYHANVQITFLGFSQYLKENDLLLVDNTEEEILEVVTEMEARLAGTWHETEENKQLQTRFWNVYITETLPDEKLPGIIQEKIDVKIGAKFLSNYKHLLS